MGNPPVVTPPLSVGQTIRLPGPEPIDLVVVAVEHGRVRLGVRAGRQVPVWREEIWRQMKQEKLRGSVEKDIP